jgi:hypothetical protein
MLPDSCPVVSAVADAILYEGYLLYPYRKSAGKNQLRWQFGVLAPRGWAERNLPPDEGLAGSAESWFQQTECLMEPGGPDDTLSLRLRFLHAQRRIVEELAQDGTLRPVPELELGGQLVLSFDEAVPLERDITVAVAALAAEPAEVILEVPGWEQAEELRDGAGLPRGRIVRARSPMTVAVRLSAVRVPAPFRLTRIRVRTENVSAPVAAGASREEALRRALLATHTVIALAGGRFVSLLDPPEWAGPAVSECVNVHTMPVLAGDAGRRDLMLSSPIILYDYPRVAPESPGDLFDAGEIDEILTLRALTLTDTEKREARATDPRAAQILDRVEASGPDVFARLHGAIRSGPGGRQPAAATDGALIMAGEIAEPGPGRGDRRGPGDRRAPDSAVVMVAGLAIGKGSRVRLRPRPHGTDAHDMFLAGRYAIVEDVLTDIDGRRFVAVTIVGDPAAELQRMLGRFFHFSPDEIQPAEPA